MCAREKGLQLDGKRHDLLRMHLQMAQQMVEALYGEEEMQLALGHLRSAVRILASVCEGDAVAQRAAVREGEAEAHGGVVESASAACVVVSTVEPTAVVEAASVAGSPPLEGSGIAGASQDIPACLGGVAVEEPHPLGESEVRLDEVASVHVAGQVAPSSRGDRLADSFAHRGVRNEVYAQGDNLQELRRRSLESLGAALSINDRRYYANALCGGDREAFRQLVGHLDGLPSLAHSIDYLQQHYTGSVDHPALQEFISLLERRFS